jgi:hypothetical protein
MTLVSKSHLSIVADIYSTDDIEATCPLSRRFHFVGEPECSLPVTALTVFPSITRKVDHSRPGLSRLAVSSKIVVVSLNGFFYVEASIV